MTPADWHLLLGGLGLFTFGSFLLWFLFLWDWFTVTWKPTNRKYYRQDFWLSTTLLASGVVLTLVAGFTQQWQQTEFVRHLPPLGQKTALKWADRLKLKNKVTLPAIDFLRRTNGHRTIHKRYIGIFRDPVGYQYRREGLEVYFRHRFGWKQILKRNMLPEAVVLHSTEGESEAGAFAVFNQNNRGQYLGGSWTHFLVDRNGDIYQYGPLNRISRGQEGFNDASIGIEIVGTASRYNRDDGPGQRVSMGSIIERYQGGESAQIKAVVDLVQTLQHHYHIPDAYVFSHQDVGKIKHLEGDFPDYTWLKLNIRDRVYLGVAPELNAQRKPEGYYAYLEPYDRKDPGRDVMELVYRLLQGQAHN